MTQNEEPQPVYRRIADELRAAISAGRYAPGDRLPGENALMAEYGVARMTARQALSVLASEGLTATRKGAGVFVRDYVPVRRHGISRLAKSRWGTGKSIWGRDAESRELRVDVLDVAERSAPPEIAAVLGLAPGDRVWVRDRNYLLDGRPVMTARSWLPADLVDGTAATRPDTGPGGVFARLAEVGHEPVHVVEEVRARMPSPAESEQLALGTGTPVIAVARTAFDARERAVELSEMVLNSDHYILDYEFDL